MRRFTGIATAAAAVSLGLLSLGAAPAQAAAPEQAAALADTGSATAKTTKADRAFAQGMKSSANPDAKLYAGKSTVKLAKLGKGVCKTIKAYDKTESAKDAILDTLYDIRTSHGAKYTGEGDAFLVVASVYSYCPKYTKTLDKF